MRVKICGLRSRAEAGVAVAAGAAYVGLVRFPPSPRHLSLADARWVVEAVPEGVIRVALTVDASDDALEELLEAVPIDMLQLHGRETPERVAEIREPLRPAGDEGGRDLGRGGPGADRCLRPGWPTRC